jgi:uncharacterized protein with GYD domain
MQRYISLLKWTDRGIRDVSESPRRLDAAKKAFCQGGGRLTDFYLVSGDYDVVNIGEFPSDEAYMSTLLGIASRGSVRTSSLKIFTEDQYRQIITAMPS